MRSLLQFLAICAVISLCVCYESHESTSHESFEDFFVPPNRANSFITPHGGNMDNTPRRNGLTSFNIMRTFKSPAERTAEICEDYSPCRVYAFRHGYQQAYQRYFGSQTQPQRPAMTRQY